MTEKPNLSPALVTAQQLGVPVAWLRTEGGLPYTVVLHAPTAAWETMDEFASHPLYLNATRPTWRPIEDYEPPEGYVWGEVEPEPVLLLSAAGDRALGGIPVRPNGERVPVAAGYYGTGWVKWAPLPAIED